MFTSRLALLPVVLLAANFLSAQEPSTARIQEILAARFVNPTYDTQPTKLQLRVGETAVRFPGQAFLLAPGAMPLLTAEPVLAPPPADPAAGATSAAALVDDVTIRQIRWEVTKPHRLSRLASGAVLPVPDPMSAEPLEVTATIATARLDGVALASGDVAGGPIPVEAGSATVMLLPTVTFDPTGDGLLGGENIGIYPNPLDPNAPTPVQSRTKLYEAPRAFYYLSPKSRSARVSEYFRLGDLIPPVLSDEETLEPHFAVISPRVLTFIAALEATWKEAGNNPAHLAVIRGYVSPTVRARLEQRGTKISTFSRHLYGDAIALVADDTRKLGEANRTPQMTDLNKDGKVDKADAEVLAEVVKRTMDSTKMFGGLGAAVYSSPLPNNGTPYVQFDLRGYFTAF